MTGQDWFWDPRWQEGERRADADIAAGRVTSYDDVDEFVAGLDDGDVVVGCAVVRGAAGVRCPEVP